MWARKKISAASVLYELRIDCGRRRGRGAAYVSHVCACL